MNSIVGLDALSRYNENIKSKYGNGIFNIPDYELELNNYVSIDAVSDNPFNYYHDIIDNRIDENCFANVVFNTTDALSGNFSPVCESFNGYLRIYSKMKTNTIIPNILIYKF